MSYFLTSAVEGRPLQIEVDRLYRVLQDRWPQAKTWRVTEPGQPYSHAWEWMTPDGPFEGNLTSEAVRFDGPWDECVSFAVWFRRQMPEQVRLLLFDESFNADVEVTPWMRQEDLAAAYLAAATA